MSNETSMSVLNARERLTRFYQQYDPSKLHHVNSTILRRESSIDQLFAALVAKYGPEPSPTEEVKLKPNQDRMKVRLYHFYRFYNPEKLSMIDDIVSGYWQEEQHLFKTLVEKYGPEPMVTRTGGEQRPPKRLRGLAVKGESTLQESRGGIDWSNSDEDVIDEHMARSSDKGLEMSSCSRQQLL
jgi:hypothetical protein